MDGSVVFTRLHQWALSWAHPSHQPKRHLDQFGRFCTVHYRVSLYFTMGPHFPPQNCPLPWGTWTPMNIWFLGPTQVLNPNGISIGSAIFARLTTVTDIQKDRLTEDHCTRSIAIGCTYICSTAMQPNNSTNDTTQHPFNGPLSGTTRVSQYQKDKTILDFTEARNSGWQWHQLGHMQVCSSP